MILLTRALVVLLLILTTTISSVAAQELLWSDEFRDSGSPDPSVWSYDTGGGGWSHGELQIYQKDNVSIENGKLVIRVTSSQESMWSGRTFYSGRIRSNTKLEFQYGTVEAKIKVPDVGDGLWPALWMLGTTFPDVDWPSSGEIDIMQLGSARALQLEKGTTRVGSAVHWEAFGRNQQDYNELDTLFEMTDDYHIYRLEWTPDRITTFVDDIPILSKNISPDFCFECEELHQPFFFVVSMAVGGGYTRLYHEGGITADLPAELLVDYIRLYDNGHSILSGSATTDKAPPVDSPTVSPTPEPTVMENRDDEPAPTESTPLSTNEPSEAPPPASFPTLPPVAPTSSLPIQRLEASGIQMAFTNVEPLDPMASRNWAQVTRDFLQNQVSSSIGLDLVDRVDVSVSIQSQDPPFVFRRSLRRLQQDGSTQTVKFDAAFEIQSVVEVNDVNRYIVGAFNTEEKKVAYLTRLQKIDDTFVNANDVVVSPASSVSRVVQNSNNANDPGAMGIGLIVGIVLAILAIICLVIAIVYSRRRSKSKRSTKQGAGSKSSGSDMKESVSDKAYAEDDGLYHLPADTPSTCEDSLYTSPSKGTLDYQFTCPHTSKPPGTVVTSDSDFCRYIDSFRHRDPEPSVCDTASEFTSGSQTFDYSAAYKNMQGSIADSQSQQVNNDDETIVSEFQVKAPPGNLGVVLESDAVTGIPVVTSVSETSPLVKQINIGDRLLSVDGRDVTCVMASTVSRIIAKKKDLKRTFVFARPMEI